MYECYIVLCTCVCSHCVYSRTELTIRIHVCGWGKLHLTVRKRVPCSQALPAWHHARDKMDQALPLLSGESLGTMLKTAPKITKFIDEFFVQNGVCFGFIYHLLVSSYPSMFWFRWKKGRLCKMCFSQYQASLGALEWPGDGDCDLMRSQSGGWPCLCSVAICQ